MARDLAYQEKYTQFMGEYELLQYMRLTEESKITGGPGPTCYIPHHGVWQRADQGRKLRVVFDASRRSGERSLNEHLCSGPSLQADLALILLRWRCHRFVICADIKMMYRQILVAEEDQDLPRFVWRDPQDTITHYPSAIIPFLPLK